MLKKVFMSFVALVAIAAAATGPARAQSNNTVTWDNTNVFVAANQDATVSKWDNASFTYGGVTIALSPTELPTQFVPYELDPMTQEYRAWLMVYGADGDSFTFTAPTGKVFSRIEIINANQNYAFTAYGDWTKDETNHKAVWSGTPSSTVTLGGSNLTGFDPLQSIVFTLVSASGSSEPEAQSGYSVTLVDTVDAAHWQGKVGENGTFQAFPLTELNEDTTVYVKYTGSRKVKSVVATVVPDGPSLATPLTVEALTAGTIVVNSPKNGMRYSLNGGAKQLVCEACSTATITVAAGDKVAFYGDGTNITSYYGTSIAGSGDGFTCKVYGNIMSLVDETGYETATMLPNENYVFYSLFSGNTTLTDASQLLLPATTLTNFCYYGMFQGCSGLTAAPALPATQLAQACYSYMFNGCSALTTAPELPATTLANACYRSMFQNCTTLVAAPVLPAPTLTEQCYYGMFQGCSNLGSVTCLATSGINASSSTANWLNGAGSNVTGTKTFTAATSATWPEGNNGIPEGWTRVNQ